MPDKEFNNAEKLPPYIFAQIGELRNEARANGEDIIDFGMGNPDQATPKPIVDKLIETVNFIEKSVKEERGINLNTSACAKLNKAAFTINTIIKNL